MCPNHLALLHLKATLLTSLEKDLPQVRHLTLDGNSWLKTTRGGRYHPALEGAVCPLDISYSMACWSSAQAIDFSRSPAQTLQSAYLQCAEPRNFT